MIANRGVTLPDTTAAMTPARSQKNHMLPDISTERSFPARLFALV